jgi:hypothetical protein
MARGQTLTESEIRELEQKADVIDAVDSLVSSWVQPGTSVPFIKNLQAENIKIPSGEIILGSGTPGNSFSGVRIAFPALSYNGETWNIVGVNADVLQVGIRASDGKLVFGGGHGWLDQNGLFFQNQLGEIDFLTVLGASNKIQIFSDGSDELVLKNSTGTAGNRMEVDTTSHAVMTAIFREDSVAERGLFIIGEQAPAQGMSFQVGDANEYIRLNAKGPSGGSNSIVISVTANTPPDPINNGDVNIYTKSNKIIFQFNDGGTVRYKYLDLTGTGVTWVHTTVAP